MWLAYSERDGRSFLSPAWRIPGWHPLTAPEHNERLVNGALLTTQHRPLPSPPPHTCYPRRRRPQSREIAVRMQATRFGLRSAQAFKPALRNNLRFAQRRTYQSAAENPAHVETPKAQESGLSKFWNSPVGPKTVHFWAPIMKVRLHPQQSHGNAHTRNNANIHTQWGIVLAGAADFARPADQLSLTQNLALMCTGAIWTRWCFVIKPKNYFLASVNFLLFCVGATQVTRVVRYQQTLKGDSVGDEVKKAATEEESQLEKVIKDPKSVVEAVKGGK
jgi:mitochondrial pyruvate carrier 2